MTPTAYAVGCILSPLRGCVPASHYCLPVQPHCRVAHCERNCDTDSLVGRRAHLSGGLFWVTGV